MRIALEVRALHRSYRGSGQWRYAYNLLREIARLDGDREYHLISPHGAHELDLPPMPSTFHHTYSRMPMPSHSKRRWVWEQVLLPVFVSGRGLAVCHFLLQMATWWAPCKVVVTAYDTMQDFFPEYSHVRASRSYRLQKRAFRKADCLVAISRCTRDDFVRSYRVDPGRIRVIPLAADPVFRPLGEAVELEAVRRKYRLPERFVLSILSYEPRKNTLGVIKAFAQFVGRTGFPHHLVLFGDRGWGLAPDSIERAIAETGTTQRVHLLGRVPDDELVVLYNVAEFFVFGSFYEGFGLPVLEALACGKTVVAANVSSMPEVLGDAGLSVNVAHAEELAEAMTRLATDDELRRLLQRRALAQARCFSWDETARRVLDVYRDLGNS